MLYDDFVKALKDGAFDDNLNEMFSLVKKRTFKKRRSMAVRPDEIRLGALYRINNDLPRYVPKYLRGAIVEIDQDYASNYWLAQQKSFTWFTFRIVEFAVGVKPRGFGSPDSLIYNPPRYRVGKKIWLNFSEVTPVTELFPEVDSEINKIRNRYMEK